MGMDVEEILEGLAQLTAAQVYDALSYYQDHRQEIERDIRENRVPRVARRLGFVIEKGGRLAKKNSQR
jgi:hypothetical protein